MNDAAARFVAALHERGATVATAESCTGGLLAAAITDIPGASDVFTHGFITYSDAAKQQLLGVKAATIAANGAVSAECVKEMAAGALLVARARVALAVSGIAGPGGARPDKPVGLVWIGVASLRGVEAVEKRFSGERDEVRRAAVEAALELGMRALAGA